MPSLPPRWEDAARWWDEFRVAAAFLTRLPLGPNPLAGAVPLATASWAFPLVGLAVGLLGGLGYALAAWLNIPPLPAALIAVAVTILVTGGLHEDGLADAADGLAGADPPGRLAIMRDSRIGSYGVLALVLGVGLRVAALAAIGGSGDGGRVAAALLAAHAAGRGYLPLVLRALEPARADGLGAAAGRPDAAPAWLAAALTLPIALFALGFAAGIVALLAAAVLIAAGAAVAQRRIGGYTGDILGALEQGGETVVLLVAAAA
jgi:adenosylcobinamide-GDP ribazoletransferase